MVVIWSYWGGGEWLLEQRFEEKMLQVVRDFKGDKAVGPDEFTMAFFHHC